MNDNIKNLIWTTLAIVVALQANNMITKMTAKKAMTSAGADEDEA